jgi:hypothetical protein
MKFAQQEKGEPLPKRAVRFHDKLFIREISRIADEVKADVLMVKDDHDLRIRNKECVLAVRMAMNRSITVGTGDLRGVEHKTPQGVHRCQQTKWVQ